MLSEFNTPENNKAIDILYKKGFYIGRMISGSKSFYRSQFPNNKVIFNANIVVESQGKVWYGDIDITRDEEQLQEIANELGENIYILYEMDARFENENKPINELIKASKCTITPMII